MSCSKFWELKLEAFLHDTPEKQLDLSRHEEFAQKARAAAGLLPKSQEDGETSYKVSEEVTVADHFEAAAERFVFPKVKCSHNFKEEPLFIHPLSSEKVDFPADFCKNDSRLSAAISAVTGGVQSDDWKQKFFQYWQLWYYNALRTIPHLAFMPADSRIPDHSIWEHMAITSALVPCVEGDKVKPELLLFQFSPVQEFISQARSTRDLWSGSYLISWLMSAAMKAVSDEIGPDSIIFPSLQGNGIFAAQNRELIYGAKWKNPDKSYDTTWDRVLEDHKSASFPKGDWDKMAEWVMTPTLPNRFLAIVPKGRAEEFAKKAEKSLKEELKKIAESVWACLKKNAAKDEWKNRWNKQIEAFPQITWASQPWLSREECLEKLANIPKDRDDDQNIQKRLNQMLEISENLPDKDARFFDNNGKLKNSGILWSAHYALLDAKLAARRNTRDFTAWDPASSSAFIKDSLSGKEECIGDEDFWKTLHKNHQDIFTASSHRYGAMNLIKKLWCSYDQESYLAKNLSLPYGAYKNAIKYDSVEDIAKADMQNSSYVAILAMDGDQMGKWISGAKLPKLIEQLSPKAKEYLEDKVGDLKRLLTPAYHLQFSKALANFSMYKAREIVEEFDGRLIYAGGDDVLAMLPAKQAFDCAKELRKAFRTDYDPETGYLYPGSKCDVSAGIAFGHFKAPLQMLVREAQNAQNTAKNEYNRSALAVRLYKRSGEIIHWGCKWNSIALELMQNISQFTDAGKLSKRFPYALAERLQPYADFDKSFFEIIKLDFKDVLSRQGEKLSKEESKALQENTEKYLAEEELKPEDFLKLFLTESFINRTHAEEF